MRIRGGSPASVARGAGRRPGLTSLVDVVFLLLVFFLLAGTLRAAAPFEVTPPEGGTGGPVAAERRTLWLAADGRIAVEGEVLPLPIAVEVLAEARRAASPSRPLLLRADAGARARHLLPLLEALRDAGVEEIELVVRERT